jgi:hypothetical protein
MIFYYRPTASNYLPLLCQPPPLTNALPHHRYTASQADVAVFKALKSAPDAAKYPSAARWYKHIASYEDQFATLTGDASKPYTVYGPDVAEVTLNPAKAPAAEEEDDDVDLFGSDDEEEDAEAARIREERLAEYKKKKEAKPKLAAKSVVTMDVKPWGMFLLSPLCRCTIIYPHVCAIVHRVVICFIAC